MNTTIEIGKFLETVATNKKTTTYGQVCEMFGLPRMNGLWNGHPLSSILEILDQYDAVHDRPFRSSVLVTQDNMPGAGIFEALERMKGIKNVKSKHIEIWAKELQAAYNYVW